MKTNSKKGNRVITKEQAKWSPIAKSLSIGMLSNQKKINLLCSPATTTMEKEIVKDDKEILDLFIN